MRSPQDLVSLLSEMKSLRAMCLIISVAVMSFSDGLVEAASDCNSAVITSLNMNFILQPVLSRVEVKTHADGHFRIEDPIQWSQFLSFKYSHFSCILQQPQNLQDQWKPIWSAPSPQDFILTHETIISSLGYCEIVSGTL